MLKEKILFRGSFSLPLHFLARTSILSGSLKLNKVLLKPTIDCAVITNVNIIPMNSNSVLNNKSVVIKRGIIHKIEDGDNFECAPNSQIIDGRGKYLIPGLIDMHVHIENPEYLLLFVANGVTTVRNMGGLPFILRYREHVLKRKILGPQIFTASPILDGPNSSVRWSLFVDSVEKVVPLIRSIAKTGYDYVKVYDNLSNPVYKEISKISQSFGIKVIGHIPNEVSIHEVIEEEQYSVEHIQHIREDELKAAGEAGLWCCPTLGIYEKRSSMKDKDTILSNPNIKYMHPNLVKFWFSLSSWETGSQIYKENLIKFIEYGGKVLLGTDCTMPGIIPGFSLYEEMCCLADAGLSPYEVMKAGTYSAAEHLGILATNGTIEEGKSGDLILLEGNPLEDIKNIEKREGVFTGGAYYDKESLSHILKRVEKKYVDIKR